MTVNTGQNDKLTLCRLHYRKVPINTDLPGVSEVFARLESASILGGNEARASAGRFSYWAAEPREVFEFRAGQERPFEKLQKVLIKYKLHDHQIYQKEQPPEGMFRGGWIGYFSYDLGRYIEKIPETAVDDVQLPLIRLCFYDRFIAYDHIDKNYWAIALQFPDDTGQIDYKLDTLERLLSESQNVNLQRYAPANLEKIDFSQIRSNMDKDYYLRIVEKIKRYIYDGEVYQINFSQRFECDYTAAPIKLFHWQNHHNPSGQSAYIDSGNFQIVSASPEMFITVTDGNIQTKPIKGTRPRLNETAGSVSRSEKINATNFNELLHSEKEKAELNMIVDLERNDVAKICIPGTRTVIQPRTIETYPTVFHAVATIAGMLRDNVTFYDILKAMFPGGSITGAPKIRSMEIIDETEPTARGPYTGSIGYIGIDGKVCLNIAIRTIIIANRKTFTQAGGGIVADSNPQAEWAETITKARALLAGIKATQESEQRIEEVINRKQKVELKTVRNSKNNVRNGFLE